MKRLALASAVLLSGCAGLDKLELGGFGGALGGGAGRASSVDYGRVAKGVNALRKSAEEITDSEEHYIGRAVAANILGQPRYRPLADQRLNAYVQRVTQTVAAASDRPYTFKGWHAQVLDSDEVNAFAAPGGFIFVTRGMLARTKSEDELAAVLAHEVAHVAGKHGLKAIKQARLTEAFTILGGEALKDTNKELGKLAGIFGGAVDDVVGQIVSSGYSKEKEYEADQLGASYARAAGYDPAALKNFLARLEDSGGGLFKTHPAASKRVAKLGKAGGAATGRPTAERGRRFAAAMGSL